MLLVVLGIGHPLTLIQIVLLHGADKVRSGVEVVRTRLLEAAQAEEASLVGGAAAKGPPARDAGVTCPALHLQVESFQRRHGHLSLTTTWRRQGNVQLGSFIMTSGLICTYMLYNPEYDAAKICWIT